MKRKRLLCAVLALVLLFSVQPAAAALLSNQRSTNITTRLRMPKIRVTVTNYASVYINPLKMPVYIDSEATTDQIISTPACAVNFSEVPLEVDLTVSGSVKEGSDMTLATSPTNGIGTEKQAFVYFEIQQASTAYPEEVKWDSAFDASKHIVITNGGTTTKNKIFTLAPVTMDGEVGEGGSAPFRLTGDAVTKPTNVWNGKDGINVTVAFTFTPLSYPVS